MQYTKQIYLPRGRALLAKVLSASGDVIDIDIVTKTLGTSRTDSAKRLARWTEQGWLRRVGRGAYVPVALDTMGAKLVLDDPWVLVPSLYEPAYIAGRTAAEHWNLTEQIFKDIVVVTGQVIRKRWQERHGTKFFLKHINEEKIFGTKPVWRHRTKVPVADVHRTIIDMLDDPGIGGGIQHVSECLSAYFKRSDRSDIKLVQYSERLGNGAVFKRLGFLAERQPETEWLIERCRSYLTAGNAKLDPALVCPRLISRWRLRIPLSWTPGRPA